MDAEPADVEPPLGNVKRHESSNLSLKYCDKSVLMFIRPRAFRPRVQLQTRIGSQSKLHIPRLSQSISGNVFRLREGPAGPGAGDTGKRGPALPDHDLEAVRRPWNPQVLISNCPLISSFPDSGKTQRPSGIRRRTLGNSTCDEAPISGKASSLRSQSELPQPYHDYTSRNQSNFLGLRLTDCIRTNGSDNGLWGVTYLIRWYVSG